MNNINYSKLSELIQVNSWTKNKKGVDLAQKIFENWMRDLGFEVEIFKQESIGNHYYYKSSRNHGKRLLLLGHMDTVFPPDTFEGFREDEEWIYGPGVCDMKGGNFVALEALRRVKKLKGEISNIDMLIVSDEETGSDNSKYITAKVAKDYDYCLVYEAAGKNGEIVIGRKGVGTFFIDIEGKAAHAGNHYIDGIDANLELAKKLEKLVELTNLEEGTTLNVGKIEGGIGANTISPYSKLTFELRYTNTDERDRVLKEIEKVVNTSYVKGTKSTLSGGIQRDVMQPNSKQKEFINFIEEVTNSNLKTESRGGVSDANIVASSGVITLDGFGPFGDGDHTIKERANKKSLESRVELSTKIFLAFVK